jgi:hypothetical protein
LVLQGNCWGTIAQHFPLIEKGTCIEIDAISWNPTHAPKVEHSNEHLWIWGAFGMWNWELGLDSDLIQIPSLPVFLKFFKLRSPT